MRALAPGMVAALCQAGAKVFRAVRKAVVFLDPPKLLATAVNEPHSSEALIEFARIVADLERLLELRNEDGLAKHAGPM